MKSILIKSAEEIKHMRIAGKLAAEVLNMIKKYIINNISTEELDQICHNYIIQKQKSISACLGYNGYPKSICTSVNDVVCHGIPDAKQKLKSGDIINIDISIINNGYYSDTSKMFILGKPSILGQRLCNVAQKSLYLALQIIKPGIPINKIGQTIESYVNKENFSVVKEYCGHGIGKNFHEDPQILHYINNDQNIILKPGMIFTVEPMINAGKPLVKCMKDGWTVKTKDRSLSAQYEHTILVTKNGCEILTFRQEENIKKILIN
ncbi:type I methionyl aminopeptidase [Buchnera aphidicola (Formosaphis micheliae)]|uniref:type I methionyl aminopeptidase n=1 Tax=Buchnera aphidicola TaxID=9 RepID=UPI0031B88EE9